MLYSAFIRIKHFLCGNMVHIDHGLEQFHGGNGVFACCGQFSQNGFAQFAFQRVISHFLQFAVQCQEQVFAGDGLCGSDDAHTAALIVDFDLYLTIGAVQLSFE